MRQEMSVSRLVEELEAVVRHHEKQEAHHAEQEVFHREKRADHAARLETARERLAAYRAAAEAAGDLLASAQLPAPATPEDDLPPGEPVIVSRLAARVIATKPSGETFGGVSIAREINRRYSKRLRRPASARTVATALRRMAAAGRIVEIEKGRGGHGGVYSRGKE